jgi:hypothetical protein
LAVGDIIVGITSAVSTYTNYQPSAGVELIVISFSGQDNILFGQYDGTNFIGTYGAASTPAYGNMNNMKLGITNTYYFRFRSDNNRAYFSAIQVK